MGQLWTDEMERELRCWRTIEVAPSPVDFLIVESSFRDVLRGLLSFIVATIQYRTLGGIESPWSLRQEIGFAAVDHELGSARAAEVDDWLDEELDFFETSNRHDA